MQNPRTPPRFWWLKRLAPAVAAVAVAWVGFHLWLTRHVDAELARRVEQWRAEGDAPLPEQIGTGTGVPPKTVDGEPNAADSLYRAMTAIPALTPKQGDEWDYRIYQPVPLTAEVAPVVRSIVEQDAKVLPLAREAVGVPAVDWDLPAIDPNTFVNFNEIRNLANHLSWSMDLAHYDGDIAGAVTDGRAAIRLATAAVDNGPSLVAGLVSTGCTALAANALRDVAWHRPPALTPDQEAAAWRAARPTVEAAIRDLLDTDADAHLIRRAWQGERVVSGDIAGNPAAAAAWGGAAPPPLRPFYTAAMLPLLDRYTEAADAPPTLAASPNDWEARLLGGDSAADATRNILLSVWLPSLDRAQTSLYRGIAARRGTAVILASKLFHAQTGRWPTSFDDLVPAYLPRVPDDPFAPPGTPMRLRTDAAVPFVYSVGDNLSDDGGSVTPAGRAGGLAGTTGPEERRDLVYPLYLPPAAARFALRFNVWYWLEDPAAAIQDAEQTEADAAAEAAEAAEDAGNDFDGDD